MSKLRLAASAAFAGIALTAGVAAVAAPAANATEVQGCDNVQAGTPTPGNPGPATCFELIFGAAPGNLGACANRAQTLIAEHHISSFTCTEGRGFIQLAVLEGFAH